MSEAFSKAIIEELQSVIREFNDLLSEQFGENFKQLNEAVGRLVEWQEQYRQQMNELQTAIDNAVAGIQASEKSLSEIEVSASNIPHHLERMEEANQALNVQIELIGESLGTFAEIRDKAINAFPEIQQNIEDITTNLSSTVEFQTEAVRGMSDNYEALTASQKASGEALMEGFNSLRTEVENTTQELSASVTGIADALKNHVENSMAEQRTVQREMLDGLQGSFNETISNATDRMNDALGQLDLAMQSEIEVFVRAMAENLSGITEKFVSDYTPLLESTRRIVELGERSNRNE